MESTPDARRTDGRQRVLSAAARCMVDRGYFGTTIRDIASEAGMTSAALYHHFASKQDILVEIMSSALADARAKTDAAVREAGSSPMDRLRAAVHAWALFHAHHRDEALVGATEIRSLDPKHRSAVVSARDEQERIFRQLVEEGMEAGEFSVGDAQIATRAVLTMGTSIANWFDPEGPLSPDEIAHEFADLAAGLVCARLT